MCGIVGILSKSRPIKPAELDRFTDSLAHRGPDGRGTYIDGPIGLGHRRLAILDPSEAGRCPMPYGGADGRRYWITYNGEVYNFLELRRELLDLGHRFRTETDTEVVAAAYAQWGPACLLRFNGMWALAIWDSTEQSLFLARDRFGIKPLYYTEGQDLYFASEIKAFKAMDNFKPGLNSTALPYIIQNVYAYEGLSQETLMQNVKRLPAGHWLAVTADGQPRLQKWWETAEHLPEIPSDYAGQVEGFRELFLDSIRLRMRSDVAIGTCLSGGVDSSAVAGAMAWEHTHNADLTRCANDWRHAFIATFPNTALDESRYAEIVIDQIKATPHYWVFDEHEALKLVLDSVWATEDLSPGLNVPLWGLYRELRRHGVAVSLDGHGGDELLCGYQWYLEYPFAQINLKLYSDFHQTLLPFILRNYDRNSMAHGIEVRMPLMDWRLVTYSFALPPAAKLGGGYTKRVLRDAMQGIMPETIRLRRGKIGLNSPLVEWFNGGFVPLLRRVFAHPLWLDNPNWAGAKIAAETLFKSEQRGWTNNDWATCMNTWILVSIVLWQLLFVEDDANVLTNGLYEES